MFYYQNALKFTFRALVLENFLGGMPPRQTPLVLHVQLGPPTMRYLLRLCKTLRCWLCSTRYTAVRINNCLKRTSAMKVATMKITDDFRCEWKPSRAYHKAIHVPTTKSSLFAVSKDDGTQRRTLVSL